MRTTCFKPVAANRPVSETHVECRVAPKQSETNSMTSRGDRSVPRPSYSVGRCRVTSPAAGSLSTRRRGDDDLNAVARLFGCESIADGDRAVGQGGTGVAIAANGIAGDIPELLAEPFGNVVGFDGATQVLGAAAALGQRHRQRLVERLGGTFDVGGGDHQGVVAELVGGAGSFGEDQDAVTLVEQAALFGDEVHTVDDGVDEEDVVPLHRGQRARVVLAHDQLDWLPAGLDVGVAGVDPADDRADVVEVVLVLLVLHPRRHHDRDEVDATEEVGVRFEEATEGLETANDVLARFGAVDAENRVLVEEARQVAVVPSRLLAVGGAPDGLDVDRDRVVADFDPATVPEDTTTVVVDHRAGDVGLAGVHKTAGVIARLESNDVVAEHAFTDGTADFQRQQA